MSEAITKELEYNFTAEEIKNLAFSVANAVGEVERLEEEKATFNLGHKERIKEARAQVKLLAGKIRRGSEMRQIDCRIENDYGAKKVRIYRTDTDEMVAEREMTPDERQQFLFKNTPEAPGPRQVDVS